MTNNAFNDFLILVTNPMIQTTTFIGGVVLIFTLFGGNIILDCLFSLTNKKRFKLLFLMSMFLIALSIVAYKIITFQISFRDLIMMSVGGIMVGLLTAIFLYIKENNKEK